MVDVVVGPNDSQGFIGRHQPVGTPIIPRNLLRHWRGVLRRAGLDPVPPSTPSGMRLPCFSWPSACPSKVSLTADLYGHLALDVTRDALEVMDVLA